jgi:hypothetical protein
MSEQARRPRRAVVAVAGWFAAAALATGVTLAAITVIGSGIFGESTRTRSQAEVAQALASLTPAVASTTPPTGSPTAPSTRSGPATPSRRLIPSAGGSVLAQCTGRDVLVLSWTPAQGYRVEDVDQEARHDVEVRFEGDDDEVRVKIRCADGRPVAEIEQD